MCSDLLTEKCVAEDVFKGSAKSRALRASCSTCCRALCASCPTCSCASRASCSTCSHASSTSNPSRTFNLHALLTVNHFDMQPLLMKCYYSGFIHK